MKKINTISWMTAVGIVASMAMVLPAFAQTSVGANVNVQGGIHNGANGGMRIPPAVFGTVTAINGDTLTVVSELYAHPMPEMPATVTSTRPTPPSAGTSVTYTVDASNAQIYKGSATTTVSVSSIAINDNVAVQGTVSGTNITATVIRDDIAGIMRRPGSMGNGSGSFGGGYGASSTPNNPIIQGNGEPVVGGSVTAISGTTLTVTNPSNVTYTIDAASTTIEKNGTSSAIGNIAVGDNVLVQGVVNGNSVTASSIIDQGVKVGGNALSSMSHGGGGMKVFGGIFASIGGFFQHLFGF